jgi:hypothetical protein
MAQSYMIDPLAPPTETKIPPEITMLNTQLNKMIEVRDWAWCDWCRISSRRLIKFWTSMRMTFLRITGSRCIMWIRN